MVDEEDNIRPDNTENGEYLGENTLSLENSNVLDEIEGALEDKPAGKKPIMTNVRSDDTKERQITQFVSMNEWLKKFGLKRNPFTFNIIPSIFVGYDEQKHMLMRTIEEGHKIVFVTGPTGSGKTTMLKWLASSLDDDYYTIYIGKPPDSAEMFTIIFNDFFVPKGFFGWIKRRFITNIKNLYQVPDFLNKKVGNKRLVVLLDEVHESKNGVLEWLRVLADQVNNMTIVLSGLPVFETNLSTIETFRKRIAARIELISLTKEEMRDLIGLRLRNEGGTGNEFDSVMDFIYERSHGFPREVIRICNGIVDNAVRRNETTIRPQIAAYAPQKEAPSSSALEHMTPMQRQILEMLAQPKTPGQIANAIDLQKYKSRQHAVRSVNNILKVLMAGGYVERVKEEKAFLYHLSPRIRTLVVKS